MQDIHGELLLRIYSPCRRSAAGLPPSCSAPSPFPAKRVPGMARRSAASLCLRSSTRSRCPMPSALKHVQAYLNATDYALLRAHMKKTDLSASKLIAKMIRTSTVVVEMPPAPEPLENQKAIVLLGKMSNNLNQIARRMNAAKLDPKSMITKQEFNLLDRAMTLLIAHWRGVINTNEVCEGFGITQWLARDAEVSAAKAASALTQVADDKTRVPPIAAKRDFDPPSASGLNSYVQAPLASPPALPGSKP